MTSFPQPNMITQNANATAIDGCKLIFLQEVITSCIGVRVWLHLWRELVVPQPSPEMGSLNQEMVPIPNASDRLESGRNR
jgi:hypothetical protein